MKVGALYLEGCQARVKRARAALVNDDDRLASLLADVFADVLGDLPEVKTVTAADQILPPTSGHKPVLYLCQDKPTAEDRGIWSGMVEATYFRSRAIAPLDASDIEAACRGRGYSVDVHVSMSHERDGLHEDTARIQVRQAAPPVPVLATAPDAETVRYFAAGVGGRLCSAVRYKGERIGIHLMGEPAEVDASAELTSWRIVGTEAKATGDGQQRMTVHAAFAVQPSRHISGNSIVPALRNAVKDYTGIVEPGIGRVSVAGVDVTPPEIERHRQRPYVVTATFTLTYRIG